MSSHYFNIYFLFFFQTINKYALEDDIATSKSDMAILKPQITSLNSLFDNDRSEWEPRFQRQFPTYDTVNNQPGNQQKLLLVSLQRQEGNLINCKIFKYNILL